MITKINEDLKVAMRDKDGATLNVLRALKTAFTNASLVKGNVSAELTAVEIAAIIRKQISQRGDSINAFLTAQRQDLIAKEEQEIEILRRYLEPDLTDDELLKIVTNVLLEFPTPTKKDMGGIIKRVQEIVAGRADNKKISALVGKSLS